MRNAQCRTAPAALRPPQVSKEPQLKIYTIPTVSFDAGGLGCGPTRVFAKAQKPSKQLSASTSRSRILSVTTTTPTLLECLCSNVPPYSSDDATRPLHLLLNSSLVSGKKIRPGLGSVVLR